MLVSTRGATAIERKKVENMSRLLQLLSVVTILGAGSALCAKPHETGFLNRKVTSQGTEYRYVVYVPDGWDKHKKWPVVLFLHGSGERGEDGLIQSEVGLGGAIRRHIERYPAVVVMPQCRDKVWWADPAMESQVLAALDAAMKEFNGDPSRVYLTGLSMGGYGTWSIAAGHPGRFAALVPVCGGIRRPDAGAVQEGPADPYAETAKKIGATPVWIFHGNADQSVPVGESRKMEAALKANSGNVKYTEYEGVGHNSWDKAYSEAELPAWLFAQKLEKH
jgi:predicted peptidase